MFATAADLGRFAQALLADATPVLSPTSVRRMFASLQGLLTHHGGVALAATLHRLYPQHFTLARTLGSIGKQATLTVIRAGEAPQVIASGWKTTLDAYRARREGYLIYR